VHCDEQHQETNVIKKLVAGCGIALAAAVHVPVALAQAYPTKPIKMLVGFTTGGSTDGSARLIADRLSRRLGQPVVVENRAGASGAVASDFIAKAEPDGYQLLMAASATQTYAVISKRPGLDLAQDFTPISLVTTGPLVLVVSSGSPIKSVQELIELARSKPGGISYASDGVGGISHVAGEFFNSVAKTKVVHVPYKGGGDSALATASGQVEMNFASVAGALPMLTAKRLRPLAVTGPRRSSLLPDVPTLAEIGLPGMDLVGWAGLVGPPGMPKRIVDQLSAAVREIEAQPEVQEVIVRQGFEVQGGSPEEFRRFLATTATQIERVIKENPIKLD